MSNSRPEMTRHPFPCKDCTDRHVGCHSECPKYIAAKEDNDEKKERIREAKARENIIWGFKKKTIAATKRTAGRKRRR